ncbi:hypothetical protein HGRIS_010239 [Hohenbuehelia grisea]
MLWSPVLVMVATSTALAGVMSGAGMLSLFIGLIAYTSSMAIVSSLAFGFLIATLVIIKRNLAALNEAADPWPPVREVEEKPRPSFGTEDIDAIRDGASWITSNYSTSSRHNSGSGWSFTTHHTTVASSHHGHPRHPAAESHPSIPAKSSYWFSSSTPADPSIPPVPPIPSPYGPLSPTAEGLRDSDPFRRVATPQPESEKHARDRFGSQTSWLTSTNASHITPPAWSFPPTPHGSMRNVSTPSIVDLHAELLPSNRPSTTVNRTPTPGLSQAQVLGGYGFTPGSYEAEKGLAALAAPVSSLDVSMSRAIGWFVMIWVPLVLSIPYLTLLSSSKIPSTVVSILLTLSVTLSSPILALNILLRSPIPIPHGLFDVHSELPSHVMRGPSPTETAPSHRFSYEYKRSTSASVTVVEGRRSGDVWISKGDAVDGKTKIGRALGMLSPRPKLSVLPPEEQDDADLVPPLPIRDGNSSLPVSIHNTPHSQLSAEMGRLRRSESNEESLAYTGRVMIAQRHLSAVAKTIVVEASPDKDHRPSVVPDVVLGATGAAPGKRSRHSAHLRSRSVTSVQASLPDTPTGGSFSRSSPSPTPPPAFPLPPTPPNVRAARLAKLAHKKSFSSGSAIEGGYAFGEVDDINQIDALTAGVLPVLVPGLKVGKEMRIKKGDYSPPATLSKGARMANPLRMKHEEFGALPSDSESSAPKAYTTPARRPRGRKESAHKRHHFSLPSLGLGKEGIQSLAHWTAEVKGALEHKVGQYTALPGNVDVGRRATVWGGETEANGAASQLRPVREELEGTSFGLARAMSTRTLGLRADVPHSVDNSLRLSTASMGLPPHSAASTATLFDIDADLQNILEMSGPQAESTPHNTVVRKNAPRARPPPLPLADSNYRRASASSGRRSSIVYIKSSSPSDNENQPRTFVTPEHQHRDAASGSLDEAPSSTRSTLAQWSSRAVRPLMPKAGKLQRKLSNAGSSKPHHNSSKQGSPGGGLRPLSLLQDRDPNSMVASNYSTAKPAPVQGGTRPLMLGKKERTARGGAGVLKPVDENTGEVFGRSGAGRYDENVAPVAGNGAKLRALQLARSDTSRVRGILRQTEVLPDVVVRPPSDVIGS